MDPFKIRKIPGLTDLTAEPAKRQRAYVEQGVFPRLAMTRPTFTFAPMHHEPGYAYPLIVWLHGDGEDERQLMRVMPMLSLRNYVAIAPRGNASPTPTKKGFYWPREAYDETLAGVLECLETVKQRYRISQQRIYLVGSGGGGTMALRLAFKNPCFFAGVASLDGPIPDDGMLLEHLKELRKVRIMIGLSRSSEKYPVAEVCEHLPMLHAAGLAVTVRNYPTAGTLQIDMLRDVDRWIMGSIDSVVK